MWPYLTAFVLIALILFDIVVIAQSNKSHYEAWRREFQRVYESLEAYQYGMISRTMDEDAIRDLYDENHLDVKASVEYYLEAKEKCNQSNIE